MWCATGEPGPTALQARGTSETSTSMPAHGGTLPHFHCALCVKRMDDCTESASSLDTPIGTVKTRLRLGLDKLRATLVPGWEGKEHLDG